MKKFSPRIFAFYLPQFHPTIDNDQWWGKGFTEWTNVGRAKPLFKGHYQPHIPADLGYYDLRLPEVREAQAALAREAGIEGFCYYHYWFGDGKQELELPFNEVLRLGRPDFPFCLCWANETWHSKFWDSNGGTFSKKVLIEQRYLGTQDNVKHFNSLLLAFRDSRYIKVDGKLLFLIYKPLQFDGIKDFIREWRNLAAQNGLKDFYFVAQLGQLGKDPTKDEIAETLDLGFDAINIVRLWSALSKRSFIHKVYDKIFSYITNVPRVADYKHVYPYFIGDDEKEENIFPTIIPNWDHSPRSGHNGYVLKNSTPSLFRNHLQNVFDIVRKKSNQIVFIKSWNEWGEGNYMEPDLKFGKGYIETLKNEVEAFNSK